MAVIEINNNNFEKEVLESDKKVLVDFWASWCGPCKMIAPVVEAVADNNPEVKVVKVNIDEHGELAERYQIISIPTLLVMEKGEIINKSVGLVSKQEVENLIK